MSFAQLRQARAQRLGRSQLAPARLPAEPPQPAVQPSPPPAPSDSSSGAPPPLTPPAPPPQAPPPAPPPAQVVATYPDLGDRLEVRTTPDRGRGVFAGGGAATADEKPKVVFKPGDTLLALAPHAQALSHGALRTTCAGCLLAPADRALAAAGSGGGEDVLELLVCSGCRVTRYCSTTCQTRAWPAHKPECGGLAAVRRGFLRAQAAGTAVSGASGGKGGGGSWVPGEGVRALARLVGERKRRREENGGRDGLWWRQIAALHSHRPALPPVDPKAGTPAPYAQLAIALSVFLGACYPEARVAAVSGAGVEKGKDTSAGEEGKTAEDVQIGGGAQADMAFFGFSGVSEVLDLCCAFTTNAFTLSSPALSPLGVAVSPTCALFNHSCRPNAVVVFPEGAEAGMAVVAIREIEQGEEVLTSYVDLALPRALRQHALRSQYRFTCACALCTRGEGRDLRVREVGRVDGGEAWVKEGMEVLRKDEKGEVHTPHDLLALHVPALLATLAQQYAPTAYPLLPLLRLTAAVLLAALPHAPALLEQAVQAAGAVAGALGAGGGEGEGVEEGEGEGVYPKGHPAVGVAWAEFGKALLVPVPSLSPSENGGGGGGGGARAPSAERDWPAFLPAALAPLLPSAPAPRLQLAHAVLLRALADLRTGFGRAKGGGLVGRQVAGLVEGVGRELAALRAGGHAALLPM